MKLLSIKPSTNKDKKLMATFDNGRTIHFGATGYKDFTIYSKQDPKLAKQKKESYLARHRVNEDWNDVMSAGSLSRWILWNKPTIEASVKDFKNHFNL
jgi:hypothetical protein